MSLPCSHFPRPEMSVNTQMIPACRRSDDYPGKTDHHRFRLFDEFVHHRFERRISVLSTRSVSIASR